MNQEIALTRNIERKLKKSFTKYKLREIFQNQKKKKLMNILLNQKEFLIKKKNIIIMIVMILITME